MVLGSRHRPSCSVATVAKSQQKRHVPAEAEVVAANRRARRDYDILQTLECGIVLTGSEAKSLRESKADIAETYATVLGGELWLVGMHISPYSHSASAFGHEPDRRRKLLAHRDEIDKLSARLDRERLTLIPLAIYFLKGRAKVNIALARGRKQHDRRQAIAERDAVREAQRAGARQHRN